MLPTADALWLPAANENLGPQTNLDGLFATQASCGEVTINRRSCHPLKLKPPKEAPGATSAPTVLHARHRCMLSASQMQRLCKIAPGLKWDMATLRLAEEANLPHFDRLIPTEKLLPTICHFLLRHTAT